MPISNRQKAMIHVAKSQLNIEDADYRAMLQRVAGVTSSTRLDMPGFERVMAEFERIGFQATRPRISPTTQGRRQDMATPAQLGKIRSMWLEYTGRDDALALGRWLEKHFHVSHAHFLRGLDAGKCIGVLKSMRALKATSGRERAAS